MTAQEWQPIETNQSKPYEKVDLWVSYGGKSFSRIADAYKSGNGLYWLLDGRYIEGRRYWDNEEVDYVFNRDDKGPEATVVTHWRPLPEPPK